MTTIDGPVALLTILLAGVTAATVLLGAPAHGWELIVWACVAAIYAARFRWEARP